MSISPRFSEDGPMANYLYQVQHGHIIINAEGRPYLLDTGAPFSVGYEPIRLGGTIYPVESSYMGVTCSYLMEHVGAPIEGMIGTDIISRYTLSIYATERMVQFNHLPPVGDITLPIKDYMGIPIVCVKVGDRVLRLFFDTGAPTSYLLPEHLVGAEAEGRHEDFYPLLGNFLTHVYGLEVTVGGAQRTLRFGELPEELRSLLEAAGVDGILGTEFLRHFGVNLSIRDKVMKLERPHTQLGLAAG